MARNPSTSGAVVLAIASPPNPPTSRLKFQPKSEPEITAPTPNAQSQL